MLSVHLSCAVQSTTISWQVDIFALANGISVPMLTTYAVQSAGNSWQFDIFALASGASVPMLTTYAVQSAENSWQFDIFALAEATPGHTLSVLYYHLHKQSGLLQTFPLDEAKFCNYLRKMDNGYDPLVPYHNR